MTSKILVKPVMIRWAIETSKLSLAQVTELFPKLKQWLATECELSISEIQKLSKALQIPFGYLLLSQPPAEEPTLLKHRTINNLEHERASRDLLDTIYLMEAKQTFMRESLIDDGFLPHEFIGSVTLNDSPENVAKSICATLKLSTTWNLNDTSALGYLKRASSNAGILIMQNGIVGNNTHRCLDINEFRAFVLLDEYAPLIFLNSRDSQHAKIFSLCHELAHIWLGESDFFNDHIQQENHYLNAKVEHFCNDVAAEMILPREQLISYYDPKLSNTDNITLLAKHFCASDLVICLRLKKLNLIKKREFEQLYPALVEKMRQNLALRDSSAGGNYYNTQLSRLDHNFIALVDQKAQEGKILYSEAYELLGAKGKTYDNLIQHLEEQLYG